MKAIVMTGTAGEAVLKHDRSAPALRPGYVLVDVKAVALNPTDWKHIDYLNVKDCLVGCDVCCPGSSHILAALNPTADLSLVRRRRRTNRHRLRYSLARWRPHLRLRQRREQAADRGRCVRRADCCAG